MQSSSIITFSPISAQNPISEVIKQAFDMTLDVSGGWGYDAQSPLCLHSVSTPLAQLQHTLASIRAHLEMSMTLPPKERYGGINLNEISRESRQEGNLEAVTYRVTAMLESDYADFINAYKEGYGTEDFDMEMHFRDREAATLQRDITLWFQKHD